MKKTDRDMEFGETKTVREGERERGARERRERGVGGGRERKRGRKGERPAWNLDRGYRQVGEQSGRGGEEQQRLSSQK